MQRIRPGSLMIRVLAVFFAILTAYATYQNVSRHPIDMRPASVKTPALETPALETAAAGPEILLQEPIETAAPETIRQRPY